MGMVLNLDSSIVHIDHNVSTPAMGAIAWKRWNIFAAPKAFLKKFSPSRISRRGFVVLIYFTFRSIGHGIDLKYPLSISSCTVSRPVSYTVPPPSLPNHGAALPASTSNCFRTSKVRRGRVSTPNGRDLAHGGVPFGDKKNPPVPPYRSTIVP